MVGAGDAAYGDLSVRDEMSRKWTDAVCAEGVDSTDRWLLNRSLTSRISCPTTELVPRTRGNEQQVLVQVSARITAERRAISS